MIVSYDFVRHMLRELSGVDDLHYQKMMSANSNNAIEMKGYINELVVPYYSMCDEQSKEKIKNSILYILTDESRDFRDFLEKMDFPFDLPSQPKNIIVWLWEALFPNEPIQKIKMEDYELRNDVETFNSLRMSSHKKRPNK